MRSRAASLGDRSVRVARPASVAEAFTLNARRAPEKLCLRFEAGDWNYGRLLALAEAFAAALRSWSRAIASRSSSETTRTSTSPTSARTWQAA